MEIEEILLQYTNIMANNQRLLIIINKNEQIQIKNENKNNK